MGIRVVAVDNDPVLLKRISEILKGMDGVELTGVFEEAVAVVDFVREHPTDMVFTDIVMPDISGISLAKEIYRQQNPPAVVLLSSIPGFSLEAWKIHAYGFIEKPYTRADIVRMIEKYKGCFVNPG